MHRSVTCPFCTDETMFNECSGFRPDSWQKLAMKPVLPYFQAIGMDQLGLIRAGGCAWTLLSTTVEIYRPVVPAELLTLTMEGVRREGLLYRVETAVSGSDGMPAARCTTWYALFDFTSRHICRNEELLSRYPEGNGVPRMESTSRRKAELNSFAAAFTVTVPASWMDMVGHVNNTHYGELCYNGMTKEEQLRIGQLRRMELYFTGEISEGENITLLRQQLPDSSLAFAGIRSRDNSRSFLAYFYF